MKLKALLLLSFSIVYLCTNAQPTQLSKRQITEDIEFLRDLLEQKSSYAYLNGYDFNTDFNQYVENIADSVTIEDFGRFLTATIGKIGDRHARVNGYGREALFLPFMYAPEEGNVLVLNSNQNKQLEVLHSKFPYLKKIDTYDIAAFIQKIRPEDIAAPSTTYFTRAVRDIRDIEKNYKILGKELPEEIQLTLTDATFLNDTILTVSPVGKRKRLRPWDEDFKRKYVLVKDEEFNTPEIIEGLFSYQDNIARIHIPSMVSVDEAPLLFEKIPSFMQSIQDSKALIIDVRSNGGGTRDLLYEFAKYLIHPTDIHVINATKQRSSMPLPTALKERLNARYLHPYSELDKDEKQAVTQFLNEFTPMYQLDESTYSEYYFGVLNGKKMTDTASYYGKPVYILANEKTFSAASVFVASLKGIKNIQVVGVTTDGSSGNSEWFDLPNSEIYGKISTMVSFQKDGKILDGYGTEPDLKIERDRNQILWKSDSQLEKLRAVIENQK